MLQSLIKNFFTPAKNKLKKKKLIDKNIFLDIVIIKAFILKHETNKMFDEIKDFVGKNKFWFIIGGIIFAVAGAVMAGLISLYFLIAVAVGLIVSVVSGLVKNKEMKQYEQQKIIAKKGETPDLLHRFENQKTYDPENDKLHDQNEAAPPISTLTPDNKELEEYKKEARKRITKEYVQRLLKSVEQREKITKSQNMCSSLIKENGFGFRGNGDAFNIIKSHFSTIEIKNISKNFETAIRGDIEVLFEVLTGVEWSKAEYMSGIFYGLAEELNFAAQGQGHHGFSKCFFEHTILCALEIYKNRELLKLYTDETLTNDEKCQKRPLLQFDDWDEDHKHGSVLKQPKTDTSLDQNQLE